ncbi:MAG: Dimethylallyladenosine tRNA methylthiotransferase [Candidatus Eremiobacteraeota bacterium]|nr:Dimethylallyladenosine tRNA methylthiotransferase [Candidatus Eremiobacteraeota bacterium]
MTKGRALVVNASVDRPRGGRQQLVAFYNLGALKLADYWREQGFDVTERPANPEGPLLDLDVRGFDAVGESAIFSWHVPRAAEIAHAAKEAGANVTAGGPGFVKLRSWFKDRTGVSPFWKPHPKFDLQRAKRKYVYAVRGCEGERLDDGSHRPCDFCPVIAIEGSEYKYDEDFIPAECELTNNPSGMPEWMQEAVIRKYTVTGTKLIDMKSGFEPGHFDEAAYARWRPIIRGPWRWGFDRIDEEHNAGRMARILADVSPRRKMVYAMCGHEPIATCYERARKVIEWGCEPWVQFMIPLTARDRYDPATWADEDRVKLEKSEWTVQLGNDFARYYCGRIWKASPIWEYRPRIHEPPPFAALKPASIAA